MGGGKFLHIGLITGKTLVKWLSHLSIILLLLLCSLWILRAPLVQWLARQPLPNEWALEITGLSSPSISQWNFKELTLKRAGAIYFTLQDGELVWSPALLWQKKLLIKRLTLNSAKFYQRQSNTSGTFKTPDFSQLPSIAINEARINHLAYIDNAQPNTLADTLSAEDYALSGDLQLVWGDTLLAVNAQLKTQQGAEIARINTQAKLDNQWAMNAQVNEPAGGMLGQALKLPVTQPLKAAAQINIEQVDNRYQINLVQLDFPWQNQLINSQGTLWVNAERTVFEVRELIITTNEHRQRIQALITPEDKQISAQLEQFPLGLVSLWLPVEGGSASGEIKAYWHNARSQLTLSAKAELISRYKGWPLRLQGEFNYSPEQLLTLQNVQAQWGEGALKSTIKAQGVLDVHGDKNNLTTSSDLFTHQHLRNLPIKWLNEPNNRLARELHGLPFSAQVKTLKLTGLLKDPLITYNLDAKTQWQGHSFDLHLEGSGDMRGAQLKQSTLHQGSGSLSLNGRFDWRGANNAMRISAANWGEAFWPVYQLTQLSAAQARVNGEAQLTGSLNAPIINTQVQLTGELSLNEVTAFTLLNNAQYQYNFAKPWPQGLSLLATENIELKFNDITRLSLSGSYTPKALNLTLNCANWDAQLNQLLQIPLAPGAGNFSLNLTGSTQTPIINGQWHYSLPNPGKEALIWQGSIATQERHLTLLSDLKEGETPLAHVRGRYPVNRLWQPEQLDAQLELTAKLAASRLILDARRYPTDGDLQVNLALSGEANAPRVDGQINLSNGSFADKLLGTELKNINLSLNLHNNQLSVQKGVAQDMGAGQLNLAGGCPQLYPAANCQLNMELAALQIINNRQLDAKAQGTIQASLRERQLAFSGNLTLAPTTLKLSNAFGSSIKELVVEEINKRGQKNASAFWPSPLIDIHWQLGANSQVRGRGLEAQLEGTLHTQGPLNQMAYNGNFHTTKGTLELFNKRFILDTGDIRLAPGQIYLDIPAHYESRVNSGEDLTIQARLQGDLNHLNLDLRSTPTLPPDEVLARLIFGKRIETITPFEGLQLAAAVNQLRAGDGFNIMDSTRSLLGVDRLNIDSEKNTDGSTGVNVGVGKYISDKVYVEIQRTPNPNTPWQGQIEVELTPSVNFESNTGQNGQGGAKLLWRRDY